MSLFFSYPHLFIFISCCSPLLRSIPASLACFLSFKWATFIPTSGLSCLLFLLLERPPPRSLQDAFFSCSSLVPDVTFSDTSPSYLTMSPAALYHFLLSFLLSSHHSLIWFYWPLHIFIVYIFQLDVHSKRIGPMSALFMAVSPVPSMWLAFVDWMDGRKERRDEWMDECI